MAAWTYLIGPVDKSRLILWCQPLNFLSSPVTEQKGGLLLRLLGCQAAIRKLPRQCFPAGRILEGGGITYPERCEGMRVGEKEWPGVPGGHDVRCRLP